MKISEIVRRNRAFKQKSHNFSHEIILLFKEEFQY